MKLSSEFLGGTLWQRVSPGSLCGSGPREQVGVGTEWAGQEPDSLIRQRESLLQEDLKVAAPEAGGGLHAYHHQTGNCSPGDVW